MWCQSSDDESLHAGHSPSTSSGSAGDSDVGLPREACGVSTEDLYEVGDTCSGDPDFLPCAPLTYYRTMIKIFCCKRFQTCFHSRTCANGSREE